MPATPQDAAFIQQKIYATDKSIDNLVFDLYGLTQSDKNLVEKSSRLNGKFI